MFRLGGLFDSSESTMNENTGRTAVKPLAVKLPHPNALDLLSLDLGLLDLAGLTPPAHEAPGSVIVVRLSEVDGT